MTHILKVAHHFDGRRGAAFKHLVLEFYRSGEPVFHIFA